MDANFDKALPPWLNEGLAEYFETVRLGTGRNIITADPQPNHLGLLRRSAMIPSAEFFAFTTADLKVMTPEKRRLYYSQAWAVTDTLFRTHKLSLSNIPETVGRLAPGDRTADELRSEYTNLETDLNQNVRGIFPPPQIITADSEVPKIDIPASTPLTSPRASLVLGDLLLHTGELARSEPFLRQAVVDLADDVRVNASFGVLLTRQEKFAEAKPYLQKAIAAGHANHLILFNYAYSRLHEFMEGSSISQIPDEAAIDIRAQLKRAIQLGPKFTDSYRLLALVDFVRDEDLDEAISLLQSGLALKNQDAEMQLLLARILLRREDVGRARQIAEQIAMTTSDTKRRAEANEIVKAAYDYTQAKAIAATMPVRLNITVGEQQGLVVLKRSWLTDEDLSRIDEERENNNYNRIILRPAFGEQQIVGRIEKITCTGGSILYQVRTNASTAANFSSNDFASVKMTVAKEGDSSFQIGCGANLSKSLAVLNFKPRAALLNAGSQGELTAVSFVADNFRLKTAEELNAARMVAIDDDTLRRSGQKMPVTPESIRRSITQSLRKPEKDEDRVVGTIEKIECSMKEVDFQVSVAGRTLKFVRAVPGRVDMAWFTVSSSQLPVTCGSGPLKSSAIFSFAKTSRFTGVDGELRAIEFVPDGFLP
jgi:tetratricopeptide (TPR) repeat protein